MDVQKIIDSLSPHERKILPYLEEKTPEKISKKSGLDEVSVTRALSFLENKDLIKLKQISNKTIDVGVNGALYRKKGLPERRLLHYLGEKSILNLGEAQKLSSLSDEE